MKDEKGTRKKRMILKQLKMVVTDLDGTLLNPQRHISDIDFQTLKLLGENEIHRVIATGRSPYATHKVLPPDFPIDYLIFSNGAGILNWNTKGIFYAQSLKPDEVVVIVNLLIGIAVDFMIHKPIPENHHFVYYQTGNENLDFIRRIVIYEQFAHPMTFNSNDFGSACQVLAIVPNDISIYENIKNQLPQFKVIRTTSPLDGDSIWIEIFPKTVSKGSAAAYLGKRLDCSPDCVLGIGNDYNDLDLLNWTEHSFVVANAPHDMRQKFKITDSNMNSGFAKAVHQKLKGLFEHYLVST